MTVDDLPYPVHLRALYPKTGRHVRYRVTSPSGLRDVAQAAREAGLMLDAILVAGQAHPLPEDL